MVIVDDILAEDAANVFMTACIFAISLWNPLTLIPTLSTPYSRSYASDRLVMKHMRSSMIVTARVIRLVKISRRRNIKQQCEEVYHRNVNWRDV